MEGLLEPLTGEQDLEERMNRGDTRGMKAEEMWDPRGSGRGRWALRCLAGELGACKAVSCQVPLRILGHGVGIAKALSVF